MSKEKMIEGLNRALCHEYTAAIQYIQHGHLVRGDMRQTFADFFHEEGHGELKHAKMLGDKIVALGGVPSIEIGEVRVSTDLKEMLQYDLEIEDQAYKLYCDLLDEFGDDVALRVMLEELALDEKSGAEELEKLLADPKAGVSAAAKKTRAKKTG